MSLTCVRFVVSAALLSLIPGGAAAQSYLQAQAFPNYNLTSSGFTVECWVKVRSLPGLDPRVIRCVGPTEGPCGDSSSEVWQLWICRASACTSGHVYFGLQDNGVCLGEVLSTVGINDGQYHHIAGTYDGAFVSVYVDGELSNSRPESGLNVQVSGGKLVVGNSTDYNNAFDGQIDEIRIWSVARTQSQIASAMTTEIALGPGLVGYWRLNGDGTDLVGGNTLIPHGSVTFVCCKLNQAADVANGPPPPTQCSDGIDNDGDGCTDYPCDGDCVSAAGNTESGTTCSVPPCGPNPIPGLGTAGALILFFIVGGSAALVLKTRLS